MPQRLLPDRTPTRDRRRWLNPPREPQSGRPVGPLDSERGKDTGGPARAGGLAHPDRARRPGQQLRLRRRRRGARSPDAPRDRALARVRPLGASCATRRARGEPGEPGAAHRGRCGVRRRRLGSADGRRLRADPRRGRAGPASRSGNPPRRPRTLTASTAARTAASRSRSWCSATRAPAGSASSTATRRPAR